MKKLRKALTAPIFVLGMGFTFFVSLFSSCEVGLGSAVDIQPPSVTIDSPKVDSVIRDVFAIRGRWSDDGTIDKVSLVLKRTDGTGQAIVIEGECQEDEVLKETGTWEVLVDYKELNIVDGTYQATVSIKDKSRHETTQSTTLTIDNTPPVLVLSRPSTKSGAIGFDSYGRTFTLEGKASDDNEVKRIEVNIYENEESTTPLQTINLDKVPLTIEQDVAKFDAEKANEYSAIYGHTDENGVIIPEEMGSSEQRYCTLTIYDTAQRFPVDGSEQTEEDKKGNFTNEYYMNSEMAGILSEYKITDLYHIKNGNLKTDSERTVTLDNVLLDMKEKVISKSQFTINPSNNPKYVVTSRSALKKNEDLDNINYQLTEGNSYLEVEIAPGLDKWPIDVDSVGLYLLECNANGIPLEKDSEGKAVEPIWLIKTGAENHTADKATIVQSGDTYKFKTINQIDKNYYQGLKIGSYYLIKVVGTDTRGTADGSEIIPDGIFAIKLISNAELIELTGQGKPEYVSKNSAAWNIQGHEKVKVTLTWKGRESDVSVFRTFANAEQGEKISNENNKPYSEGVEDPVWHFVDEIDYALLSATNFPQGITYCLKKNSDVISTNTSIRLRYDETLPGISNIQFSNSYEKVEEIPIEGQTEPDQKITYFVRNDGSNKSDISGIATDDTGIESVELIVPGFAAASIPKQTNGRFNFKAVDFSSLTASNIQAKIVATDVAGNQVEYPLDIVFDKAAPQGIHQVDGSSKDLYFRIGDSDNDDITPENPASNNGLTWNDALDKGVGGKYGNGTFGNATTIQIRGLFDDGETGSGVKMIYYKVYRQEHLLDSDSQTASQQKKALITEVMNSPTGKFAPVQTQKKRIFYNVPEKNGSPDPAFVFVGSQFTTSANSKGFYKYYKNVDTNFNNTLTGFEEGNNYIVLVVEDNVGNTAIDSAIVDFGGQATEFVNYTLNVDTTPPSDITTNSHTGIIYTNSNTKPLKLWGTVSDKSSTESGSAGIKSFVLSRDGVAEKISATVREVEATDPDAVKALAAGDPTLRIWSADVKSLLPAISQTVSISATASDNAGTGNTTPAVVATINVDLKTPEVEISTDSPADADTSDSVIQVNGKISLTGTSDDENGIDELLGLYYKTYTGNTAPSVPAENTSVPPEGWTAVTVSAEDKTGTTSWKFANINTAMLDGTNPIADGTKLCFTVAVKDKAGNIGYSAPRAVVVDQDTDRPVIHLTSLPLTYKDENQQTKNMDSNNPVWSNRSELTGTIDDDDGAVVYVKVIAKDATETNAPSEEDWTAAANVYKNGIWAYTISSNGSKKIFFQIKEKGENGRTYTSNTASTSSATYGPKIQDANSVKFGYNEAGNTADDILYVKVDTDDPILSEMKYYTGSELVADPNGITGWKETDSSIISDKFGGTNKYLYIKCKATDTNGIFSISVKFAGLDPLEGKTIEKVQGNSKEIITCFNIKDETNPVASGLTKLEINIKDNAAASTNSNGITKYYEAMVDNTDPEISFSNYSRGAQVYGSSAVTLRGTTSDSSKVEKVEYAISKTGGSVPQTGWVEITDESKPTYTSKLGWQIVFDGKTPENDSEFTDPSSFHADLLKKYLFSLYNVAQGNQASYDTTQKIYIWMRATDELGNCGTNLVDENEDGFFLDVIPNGDKPAIDITYPSNGASVGGTIRITGTTNIQDTSAIVKYVYLQIDPSYDAEDGFNEDGWASELQGLMNSKEVTSYEIKDLSGVIVEGTTTNLGTEIGKGIPSLGNSKLNWYLIINGNKELNDNVNGSNRKIAIRVFAVSSTGKVSKSNIYVCEIDPKAPTFGQTEGGALRFVQYTDNTFSSESASRTFENGLYLTGQWYLVGSVEDDSGIRLITLGDHNIVWSTGTGDAETIHDDGSGMAIKLDSSPSAASKFKNYMFRIPVGNTTPDSFGKLDYEISVADGSDSQTGNNLKFTIYYDNKAPEFEAKKGNGKDLEDGGKIYQSNGAYTVQGSFKEASLGANNQSGFKRIAMFYTRQRTVSGVKGLYLIDSMLESGNDGTDNLIKLASIGNGGTLSYETNVSKSNGLYWRKVNGTLENSNELSLTDNTYITNKTIRAGGLCMIDNVMYRISRITGTKIILEGTIPDFSTAKPVFFAYAQIIDNLSQESGKTVVYSNNDVITNGDGDCMIEGVQFSGGEYNWNASIDSSNMLDGNVTMSFVGYDAAGNFTEQSWNQKISNNAPRIAGVSFGTDIDLDGTISASEMTETYAGAFTGVINVKDGNEYNGQDTDGNWITEYTVPETLTVKGAVKVKPMIVGGNTKLGWQYTYKTKTGTTESTTPTEYAGVGHSSDGSVRTSDLSINISLKNFLAINIGEGNQDLKFTIWDKTDDSGFGEGDSAKADIILPVNIIIADTVDPTAVVSPFYWKSASENSIYQSNPANGHIELESDWAASGSLNAGNATLDKDAKVSGKITFDGVAEDNVIVQTIKAEIPGYNGGNEFVIAQRDASATETEGWISSVTLNPGTQNEQLVNHMYYKKGEEVKANASLTGVGAVDWVFELISDEYDANGKNIITFKFHFDTEKISTTAATDVSIKFTAMDKGSPTLADDNNDPDGDGTRKRVSYDEARTSDPGDTSTASGALTGCYKVDVVPYITRIETALSSLKSNNPSVYARSAQGHYAVRADEILNIEGFNVSGGTLKFEKTGGGSITANYNANAGGEGVGGYAIPDTAKSGNLIVTVHTIDSLNNANNNNAKGSYGQSVNLTTNPTGNKTIYDNYYNRQPNGDNNNLLTDDVVMDIWEIDPTAVRPKVGGITQPVMAIDPVTEHIGFAFINGTAFFSMPYGTNGKNVTPNSYEYWIGGLDEWNSISLAYDINGYSYGTAAGGDLNTSKNGVDIFRFTTSRWDGKGTLSTEGYKDLNNQFGLEYIGEREYFYDDSQSAWADFTNFSKSRIKSPSLATVATTTDKTQATVYLAYYDSINDEIRFNWGVIKNTKDSSDDAGKDAQGMFGTHYGTARSSQAYSISGTSLIAGQTNNKAISTTPTYSSSPVTTTNGTPIYGGEYVSIAALAGQGTNDDAVVAVWWDGTHHKMLYSYNKTPKSIQKGKYTQVETKWSTPAELFPAEVGEFCKVTADASYGVHIAAYDSTNGDIWYAYLNDYASTSTAKVGCLDSNGFVGSELNIDVAIEEGKPVPFVSYYASNAAKPKIARWIGDNLINVSSVAGAENELFTSNWDISYVPTKSKLIIDHINVGVWKNNSGVLKNSKTGTKDFQAGSGSTVNSKGTVWGNGTSNPVLGYATKEGSLGYIETAQMK